MRRTLWPLAALGIVVSVAAVCAGCGGSQSTSGSSTGETSGGATAAHSGNASHRARGWRAPLRRDHSAKKPLLLVDGQTVDGDVAVLTYEVV